MWISLSAGLVGCEQLNTVCIATYNGASYIVEQLQSILSQLDPEDEVLIGDDGSTDATLDLVRHVGDPRVTIFVNDKNLGHVRNFESLIERAQGNIIFLSDQDDVWFPNKYSFIVKFFGDNKTTSVFHHALLKMDGDGELIDLINNPIAQWRLRHPLCAQLTKSYVFGCCLAFRSDVKDILLPFPRSVYAHDHWIALVAAFLGGFYHYDEPLLRYRVHGKNLTPKRPLPLSVQIRIRLRQFIHVAEILRRKVLK